MLDQNTDRMWYVIGAVIVGAALIFLVNSSFPQLFASVGDVFTNKTDEVSETIVGIGSESSNLIDTATVSFHAYSAAEETYDKDTDTWSFVVPHRGNVGDGRAIATYVKDSSLHVPYGKAIAFSYDVYSDVAVKVRNDSNMYPIDESGKDVPRWGNSDNDEHEKRMINNVILGKEGIDKKGITYGQSVEIKAKEWTTISVGYSNTSSLNTGGYDVRDNSSMGIFNPSVSGPFNMKIRNFRAQYGSFATPYTSTK